MVDFIYSLPRVVQKLCVVFLLVWQMRCFSGLIPPPTSALSHSLSHSIDKRRRRSWVNSCRCRLTPLSSSCGLFLFSSAQKSFQQPERKGLNPSTCLRTSLSLPLQPTPLTPALSLSFSFSSSPSSSSSDSAAQRFRVNKFPCHFAGQTACGVPGWRFFSLFTVASLRCLASAKAPAQDELWRLRGPAVELEPKDLLP